MGVDIAVYRMRIGLYICPKCGKSKATFISCSKCFPVGVIWRIFCVVATIGIALIKCGDIESNPGPLDEFVQLVDDIRMILHKLHSFHSRLATGIKLLCML
jgi:hypothetical protein